MDGDFQKSYDVRRNLYIMCLISFLYVSSEGVVDFPYMQGDFSSSIFQISICLISISVILYLGLYLFSLRAGSYWEGSDKSGLLKKFEDLRAATNKFENSFKKYKDLTEEFNEYIRKYNEGIDSESKRLLELLSSRINNKSIVYTHEDQSLNNEIRMFLKKRFPKYSENETISDNEQSAAYYAFNYLSQYASATQRIQRDISYLADIRSFRRNFLELWLALGLGFVCCCMLWLKFCFILSDSIGIY